MLKTTTTDSDRIILTKPKDFCSSNTEWWSSSHWGVPLWVFRITLCSLISRCFHYALEKLLTETQPCDIESHTGLMDAAKQPNTMIRPPPCFTMETLIIQERKCAFSEGPAQSHPLKEFLLKAFRLIQKLVSHQRAVLIWTSLLIVFGTFLFPFLESVPFVIRTLPGCGCSPTGPSTSELKNLIVLGVDFKTSLSDECLLLIYPALSQKTDLWFITSNH